MAVIICYDAETLICLKSYSEDSYFFTGALNLTSLELK